MIKHLSVMKQYWFLILTFLCSCIQAQTYETLRDSGQVLFEALRYDAAIIQWEGAEVLARETRNRQQVSEIQDLIRTASELRLTALQQLKGYFFSATNQEAVSWAYDFASGKFRIIDRQGRPVSAPIWQNPGPFSDGIALAQQGGYQYLVDQTGRLRSDGYLFLTRTQLPFFYGIKRGRGVSKILDAIPVLADWQGTADGLALYPTEQSNRWPYLCMKDRQGRTRIFDKQGQAMFDQTFQDAFPFSPDLISVKQDDLWGIINLERQMIQSFEYESIRPLQEGFATVQKDGKWGFLDQHGVKSIPCQYESASSFDQAIAAVKTEGKWGFIDTTGQMIIPAVYLRHTAFVDGKAWVLDIQGWTMIDLKGNTLTPDRYDDYMQLEGFFDSQVDTYQMLLPSFWQVQKGENWGVINGDGEPVMPVRFQSLDWMAENSLKARSGDTLRVWTYDSVNARFEQKGQHFALLGEEGTFIYTNQGKRLNREKTMLTRWSSEGLMAYHISPSWYRWRADKGRFVKMSSQWSLSSFTYGFAVATEYSWSNRAGEHIPSHQLLDVHGEELENYKSIQKEDFSKDLLVLGPREDVEMFIQVNDRSYWLAPVHDIRPVWPLISLDGPEGYAFFYDKGKIGIRDAKNQIFIKPVYDMLKPIDDGQWLYQKDDQFGFLDATGTPYVSQTPSVKTISSILFEDFEIDESDYIPIDPSPPSSNIPSESGFNPFSFPTVEAGEKSIQWEKNTGNIRFVDSSQSQQLGYQGFQQRPYTPPKKPITSISRELEEGLDLSTKSGPEIIALLFDNKRSIPNVYFTQGGKQGYMLIENAPDSSVVLSKFLPVEYDQIEVELENEDWIPVYQNGKWGFVHWEYQADLGYHRGVLRIPCIYDAVSPFQHRGNDLLARVYLDAKNLIYYINTEGKMMVSP